MKILSMAIGLGLLSSIASAQDDGAYLDSKYQNLVHPKSVKNSMNKAFPISDTKAVIAYQSPIRSQASRGTCSIFSATAYLEGLLIKKGINASLDLSEEWLQYTAVRNKSSDGSSAWDNFAAIRDYGMVSEQSLPYIGEDWTEVFNPLKDQRCGKLLGPVQKSCFIVHRDPNLLNLTDIQINALYADKEFINARKEALDFKNKNIKFSSTNFSLYNVSDVKNLLSSGTPVVLEVDFYYGSWNHREADQFGIGRNLDHWSKGIVTFPEAGSLDETQSKKHPAGHSILVVGYDDNKIIEKTIKMANGTTQKFTYKGVYYFKNSWGTSSFGKDFQINGVNFPGYGMIVAKYAEEIGQFFQMPLK
ncbi:MAG: C1 family peptidase [Bacteriovorax sp.]|nr:C1 family peptidase [Bacteriovorax sp.]